MGTSEGCCISPFLLLLYLLSVTHVTTVTILNLQGVFVTRRQLPVTPLLHPHSIAGSIALE